MSNFRTPSASDGWRLRKRRWPAHPSRKSWSRIPTTASASSRFTTAPTTAEPLVRGKSRSPWIVSQRIDDPDVARAKAQALEDIAQGATGLSLVFEGAPNAFGYGLPRTAEALETVLDGVPLNRIQIRIDAHPWSRAVADWLVAFLSKRRVRPGKAQSLLRHRSGGDLCRHRPAAHVDRGAAGIDAAIAGAFLLDGRSRRAARGGRARVPQCRRHRSAGTRHHAGFGGLAICRMFEKARQPLVYAAPAYRLCAQRRPGPVPVDGQGAGAAQALGAGPGDLLDPRLDGQHPCRDVLSHDDGSGPRNQHPAHHDRRFRRGGRRRGFDLHPAAHDRAWPAGGFCPPRRPQRAADHGQ